MGEVSKPVELGKVERKLCAMALAIAIHRVQRHKKMHTTRLVRSCLLEVLRIAQSPDDILEPLLEWTLEMVEATKLDCIVSGEYSRARMFFFASSRCFNSNTTRTMATGGGG